MRTSNLTNGAKATETYLKNIGIVLDYSDKWSLTNIVAGYHIHEESAVREIQGFFKRNQISYKLDEDQAVGFVKAVRAGLG